MLARLKPERGLPPCRSSQGSLGQPAPRVDVDHAAPVRRIEVIPLQGRLNGVNLELFDELNGE